MDSEEQMWRRNAAAVIVDAAGRVLIGKAPGIRGYWHFPQGGSLEHEEIEQTLEREVQEEIGLLPADYHILDRIDGLRYKYRAGHRNIRKWIGQQQTYFFLRCKKKLPVTKLKLCKEFSRILWMDAQNIRITMFSPAKRSVVENVLGLFLGLSPEQLAEQPVLSKKKSSNIQFTSLMDIDKYKVKPGAKINLANISTSDKSLFPGSKEDSLPFFDRLRDELQELQKVLFAQNKHKLLIIIQAMDTGGKDGCIKHCFGRVDPQGVNVVSFKKPTAEELSRDFLWRIHAGVPKTGEIVIFNRSHYEDIIAVRIKNLLPEERWKKRYRHIIDFERMLAEEGTVIVKIFLHISKAEQKLRLESRLQDPNKYWKFHQDDLDDRAKWNEFEEVYSDLIEQTSTDAAPWYIIPADRKWYRNIVVSDLVVSVLNEIKLEFPKVNFDPSKIVVPD